MYVVVFYFLIRCWKIRWYFGFVSSARLPHPRLRLFNLLHRISWNFMRFFAKTFESWWFKYCFLKSLLSVLDFFFWSGTFLVVFILSPLAPPHYMEYNTQYKWPYITCGMAPLIFSGSFLINLNISGLKLQLCPEMFISLWDLHRFCACVFEFLMSHQKLKSYQDEVMA